MQTERIDRIKNCIEEIVADVDEKTAAKLELDKCRRIVERVGSFSNGCEKCDEYLDELEEHFTEIQEQAHQLTKEDYKNHYKKTEYISSHLQKKHNLIPSGYYMSLYMSLGLSFGLLFGLLVFDNIALGLPIGMVLGMAIGTGLDMDAKKKGKTI